MTSPTRHSVYWLEMNVDGGINGCCGHDDGLH